MKNLENLFPMSPAQSWVFLALLFAMVALAVYLIYCFDVFVQLSIINCSVAGVKGIFHALRGSELYEIKQEKVIEVSRAPEIGYRITTSNGERNCVYYALPSHQDEENQEWLDAIDLSGDDRHLREALLPDSRVKGFCSMKNGDQIFDLFVVYVKFDNIREIENAMNRFFEDQFHAELQKARAERCLVA